jgi:hypothetical protein
LAIVTQEASEQGVDPAVRRARLVVGLYGDPTVSWSVLLRLALAEPTSPARLQEAWHRLAATFPGVGRVGVVGEYDERGRAAFLAATADAAYGDRDPLLRVGLSRDGAELVVAAHHGCMDGLGLLGAAARLTGLELTSSARGVPADADATSFVAGSLRRLGEAAVRPPLRLAFAGHEDVAGDHLESADVHRPGGTAVLVEGAARFVRGWNTGRRARGSRLMIALGLSRRPGSPTPTPDRDTAYMRVPADDVHTVEDARRVLAATAPEPAFPVTEGGGVGPLVTRALGSRLGSTVLVSNLGLVSGPVERVEFWPVPAGPAGVCLGLASAGARSTLTVRARAGWFDESETQRMMAVAAAAYEVPAEAGSEPEEEAGPA